VEETNNPGEESPVNRGSIVEKENDRGGEGNR